jgi:hypothetical protein
MSTYTKALTLAFSLILPLAAADRNDLQRFKNIIEGQDLDPLTPAGYRVTDAGIKDMHRGAELSNLVVRFGGPDDRFGELRIRLFRTPEDAQAFASTFPEGPKMDQAGHFDAASEILHTGNSIDVIRQVLGRMPFTFVCMTAYDGAARTLKDVCGLLRSKQDNFVVVGTAGSTDQARDQIASMASGELYKTAIKLAVGQESRVRLVLDRKRDRRLFCIRSAIPADPGRKHQAGVRLGD